jgi:hypothetical protein
MEDFFEFETSNVTPHSVPIISTAIPSVISYKNIWSLTFVYGLV